ncbi:hypothetical protein F5876DRAFT_64463 [Lentinula aff. lateritia]|uniref:Uncharacterized protein n=1 Tax=Lentinula aff. lateritia TaxID=2804960 RepID=A0ACC1U492_9AGAR|nr:hypothetical protein F5876DRAFT_64463 [Lentinula aff. lateritia]
MRCLVPSKELDPFASLCDKGSSVAASKPAVSSSILAILSASCALKAPVVPPRLVRKNQELEGLKAVTPPRPTHSRDSNNEPLSGFPSTDTAPRASSSAKTSVVKMEPKSKTTVKRKSRQIVVTDDDSASNEVESEDEDEDKVTKPLPKRLKTTSSISASLPRHSVERVSVPKRVIKAAAKSAPVRSPASTFQLVLLADAQGHLQLPNQSSGEFTPFPRFAHARNSATLSGENPLLAINPEFLELGSILETQNARFTMQNLMQINQAILPFPVKLAFRHSLEGTWKLIQPYFQDTTVHIPTRYADQLKQIGSLFDTVRELFLRSILDLQKAGEDPVVVLEALKAAKPNRQSIDLNEWTLLATLFRWPSPFNLTGESTAHINEDGHLVKSSPPPDLAAKVIQDLNNVEKGSADKELISQVGGSIPMELDLPTIKSLAEPTLSPEKDSKKAQTLEL